MTSPEPEYYAPRVPTLVDTTSYTNRLVEQIVRTNPLTDASVSNGLMRWLGNYNDGGGNPINFLWIGEFNPADPNLPGTPSQKGFSLVRDDSRGGVSAIAMYDANPTASPGLKQTLFFTSGDTKRLFEESRDGGQRWPEALVPMGVLGNNTALWPGVNTTGAFTSLFEGRFSVVGNRLYYRVFCATDAATPGTFRMRVQSPGGDLVGPTHAVAAAGLAVFEDFVDVTVNRGLTVRAFFEGNRTSGAGNLRASMMSVRCYTP